MSAREFNFDGLVGPSHNHAGLSLGNLASASNVNRLADPRAAALQGLAKMHGLALRGFAQAVLPPPRRPDLPMLRAVGFDGTRARILAQAHRDAPVLLAAAYSASAMWAANAATVSPGADTADGRTHFTVANLNSKLHRSQEHWHTQRSLEAVFADRRYFVVHPALPSTPALADEGAANHSRLCTEYGAAGIEVFVHGRSEFDAAVAAPTRYPARQTREAGQAVARLHGLDSRRTVHLHQNPHMIDHGVFHNDVIAVANGTVLLYHEHAFSDEARSLHKLDTAMASIGATLQAVRVPEIAVPVADAVRSYLFNSQLLSRPDGGMTLVVPQECLAYPAVARAMHALTDSDSPIDELLSFDLRQSMRNGGGPACLRLRVVLTDQEAAAMHQEVRMTDALHARLVDWVRRHYRDRLAPGDLADPALAEEIDVALAELAGILCLPGLYDFDA